MYPEQILKHLVNRSGQLRTIRMINISFESFYNVIDGELENTTETRHGINPATLEKLPPVPVSTPEDVDRAVNASRRAAAAWAEIPIEERKQKVIQYADAIVALSDDFGRMLTTEQGKPVCALL